MNILLTHIMQFADKTKQLPIGLYELSDTCIISAKFNCIIKHAYFKSIARLLIIINLYFTTTK